MVQTLTAEQKEILPAMYDKARESLVNYRHLLLPCGDDEVKPADFHYAWSDYLLHGKGSVAKEGFRESGKSQYVLRAFPLYCLTFPATSRDYIVLINNNSTLAGKKLKEIETEYTTNPLLSGNCVKIREQSTEVFSVDVKDPNNKIINVRMEAYGKGSSIRGLANADRRPKIVVIDDPQDVEDAKSETVQASDWEWFLSDVMFLGKNTRIFLIGNNLGERCIIERVFANPKELNFNVERIPQVTVDGKSAWPGMYSLAEIEKEKLAYKELGKLDVWLRERMCQAVSDETRIFNRTDYRYYTAGAVDKIIQKANIFATLDPASSTDKESCYRAIVVNAVNTDNYWYIVDVPYGRWDAIELIDTIFEVVVKWEIKDFGIEKGIFKQILEPFIYKEMTKRNTFFNIVPLEHAKIGSKLERIKMLQPRFKAHTVWFPDNNPDWLVELELEMAGATKYALKSLYSDLLDALAMQEQIAKKPYFGANSRTLQGLPRVAEVEPVLM